MEKDREDLVSAISKLRASINELNQKGRERLLDALKKLTKNLMMFIQNFLMEALQN